MPTPRSQDPDVRWKPVPGYEGLYEVSDRGQVYSVPHRGVRGGILAHRYNTNGYPQVALIYENKRWNASVHRLVLLAFIGPCPEGLVTRHLDGNRANPRLENLTYGTPSENNRDCVRHGTHVQARKTHCKHGHPYDESNTVWRPTGGRECLECRRRKCREWGRANTAKRRAARASRRDHTHGSGQTHDAQHEDTTDTDTPGSSAHCAGLPITGVTPGGVGQSNTDTVG
jgi:hypothetical protein